jgi:aromatic-L-amino-acid decarboxylase
MGLPSSFEGVIYDTASISTLHALAAAREALIPGVRETGLTAVSGGVRVYCSEQAHSSVDKAVILLGLGHQSLRKIPVDDQFCMQRQALRAAIAEDRAAGLQPIAVVATIGTTSTTSVDPVAAIAEICRDEGVWLHVDAAYAGVAAIIPEYRDTFDGWQTADSVVVNPHKWLFTPFDLSAFYCRRMDVVRRAFSLVPEYLKTAEAARGARDLMDTGIQLGRRFRSLKLWMILRDFGAEGIRSALAEHIRLAQLFRQWVDADVDFERMAPVPFSVVCFRACAGARTMREHELDLLNQRLLDAVNATGEVFLSHTRLHNRFVLRLAVGHLRTTERHVARAWKLLKTHNAQLVAGQAS